MRVIRIEVGPDGKVTIDHQGFTGEECFREDEKLYAIIEAQGSRISIEDVSRKPEAAVRAKGHVVER